MVSKGRTVKSGLSVTKGTGVLQGQGECYDIIHVQRPQKNKAAVAVSTPEPPIPVPDSTPSSTGGVDDLSLTSPSIHETTEEPLKTPKRKRDTSSPERTLSSALRRLTATPSTSKGSANNPIVLDEYSPRRKPIPLHMSVEEAREPHSLHYRHRKLYVNSKYRRPLAPKTANGTKFTGDKSGDLSRMINAKAATIKLPPPHTRDRISYGVPFEVRYPMSAQYLATRTSPGGQYQSPYVRYHTNMGVSISGDSEEMLRRKAVQDWKHQQPLSDDSLPNTRTPRSDQMLPPSPTAKTRKKLNVYKDRADDILTTLTAQSSLLTSFLQIYPRSTNKSGLRNDIAELVAAQKKRVEEWIEAEAPGSSDLATTQISEVNESKDEEVRNLLSATAGMWQDGSGEGVADVFAEKSEDDVDGTSKKRKLEGCGRDMERVV